MKLNYKNYTINITDAKSASKKDLYRTIYTAMEAIDRISKTNKNSIKDSTSEYYKGYMIRPYVKLHDEDCDCKYEITKDGVIIDGANSIEEAKEKIDKLVADKTTYTKDASVIIEFRDFKPCSGAVDTYEKIEEAGKLDDFEMMIDELYPDGIDETELNDWLWFDGDQLLKDLGIETTENDED